MWICLSKINEFVEGANGFQVSKDLKGSLGIDMSKDVDNTNRMMGIFLEGV